MYEDVVKEIVTSRARTVVERTLPEEGEQEAHTALTIEHVNSELSSQFDTMEVEEQIPADPTFGGFGTEHHLRSHLTEWIREQLDQPIIAFNYTVPSGSRIFGPPYDNEWQVGTGFAFGARQDGSCVTMSSEGFSAAGVGFYLSSNEPQLVAITPVGNYELSWFSLEDLPALRSSAGLGMTIYVDGAPQPAVSKQVILSNLSGVTRFSADHKTGSIADAASPAVGFGPVPLAPMLINMVPGSRYLVWVWCWQMARNVADHAFIAFMNLKMQFVSVNAGPPIIIH